ncbi:hypothetical protein PI125_g7006 [Phytophthora idaei]|nr:hypothetical protein PI125_g7006 [Phytophthora idaei]KAG3161151.1 hypothetical protein PI126_g6576 [Phytophthora idaei]
MPRQQLSTDQRWAATLNTALDAAADSVGYLPFVNHVKVVDLELSRLSYERRQLRQLIYDDQTKVVKALRTKRNRLLHQIRRRSQALAKASIDEKLEVIEQLSHSVQMFKVTRALCGVAERTNTVRCGFLTQTTTIAESGRRLYGLRGRWPPRGLAQPGQACGLALAEFDSTASYTNPVPPPKDGRRRVSAFTGHQAQ